tara:strand:+ start:1425 stop:3248 length:1824 start_codon:yes stop_codon:yes gene_type:complete
MAIINYPGRARQNQYRDERDAYQEEKLALDFLKLDISQDDKREKDFLTSQAESYGGLMAQVQDGNITQEEISGIKKGLNLLDKEFKNSEYKDSTIIGATSNKYKTLLNESLEIAEDNFAWRGVKKDIVNSLINIPNYNATTGGYNTEAIKSTLQNIQNQKEYYAGEDKVKYDILEKFEKEGIKRNVVQNQLQRYTKNKIDEKENPTKAAAFREAKIAREEGDWDRAYSLLTGSSLTDVTDEKSRLDSMPTPEDTARIESDDARLKFRNLNMTGINTAAQKNGLGKYFQVWNLFASYPTSKGNWDNPDGSPGGETLSPSNIAARFKAIPDFIIKQDNLEGDALGGGIYSTGPAKYFNTPNGDRMYDAHAAYMYGLILKPIDKDDGSFNYADGAQYMKNGRVLPGMGIGEYKINLTEDIRNKMRANVKNIEYDIDGEENKEQIQFSMAGAAEAYITTLPKWTDNKWSTDNITTNKESKDLEGLGQDKVIEETKIIDTKNEEYVNNASALKKLLKQKQDLLAKVRKSKKGYEDTKAYDDKRIEGIHAKEGGAHKRFMVLNTNIKLRQEKLIDIEKLLGGSLKIKESKDEVPWYDSKETQDILDSLEPLNF